MILTRCEYLDPIARTQCNQEAFVDFEGAKQKLCKLHSSILLNSANSVDELTQMLPMKAVHKSQQPDVEFMYENKSSALLKAMETPEEKEADKSEVPVKDEETEKLPEQNEEKDKSQDNKEDINRSDAEQNEVK